jgi:mannosylglycerate hydrolase
VHRENSVRFAKSQQVGEGVLAQAMCCLAAATDTRAPFATPHTNHEPVPIIVFNAGPGPRTAEVQVVVQLPGSLYNAVIIDEQGQHMPYRVVNRWRQEIGSMPIAREMLATAVALSGITNPAELMQMAHSMILSALGQNDDTHVISHVHIEDYTESPIHHINHTPQPGVVYIEVMIAPKGRVVVNEQELLTAGQHILSFLNREDIHTLEVSLVDQARETIDFAATDLPAYGLKTFWLYPRGLDVGAPAGGALATTPGNGGASLDPSTPTSAPFIENEWYRVEASPEDGTLTVTDKQTRAVFTGLNRFVDGGDVGDLYNYCPPAHDLLVSEPQESPRIELVSAGPVRATLRVSGRWALPGACTVNRAERSSRVTTCPIVSEISLMPGVRRIDIHTSIENRAKDHRLRVVFPVSYTVEDVAAEGTFEVRMRPIAQPRPADVAEWPEEPANTFPQKRFVDISNGEIGLGVLNRGLPECEILDLADGTLDGVAAHPRAGTGQMAIALTLLRCVEWLSRGDLPNRRGHAGPMEHTPEAQCQGHYEFDYALVPHRGDWEADEALVMREARAFNLPARAIVTDQHEGQLPSCATLLEVEPRELAVSAIKQSNSGQGLVVRVYNPLSRVVEAQIRPGVACTRAFVANLQEEIQEQIFWSGEDAEPISAGVRGGEIMTIVFQ